QRVAVACRREAYAVFRRRGDKLAAANLAIYLAAEHRIAGEPGAADAWLERAEWLLEDVDELNAERGWLEVERAKRAVGDPREQGHHATTAAEIARALADANLEATALARLGLARLD